MDITIDASSFRIPTESSSRDALEIALELIDDPHIQLIQDLGRAKTRFLVNDADHSAEVLQELGCNVHRTNGSCGRRPLKAQEIAGFTRNLTWVVCPPELKLDEIQGIVLAEKRPENPKAFRQIVELRFSDDGLELIAESGGNKLAAVSTQNTQGRYNGSVCKALAKIADVVVTTETTTTILLPDTRSGIITLEAELRWAKSLVTERSHNYIPPTGSVEENILRVLMAHSDESVVIPDNVQANLRNIIRASVSKRKPVPIGITLALGMRVPHPWKNTDPLGPPTLAWLYILMEFTIMAEKVKKIYPPGVQFFIFEEGTLFFDLMGVPMEIVERNLGILDHLIKNLGAPVTVIRLEPRDFPKKEVETIKVSPTDEEIYAILCSIPEMQDSGTMDLLYTVREKDFGPMKRAMSDLWRRAAEITSTKNRLLAWRKKSDLFPRLVEEKTGESVDGRLVDAAATEKEGRICLKLTAWAMFNHGATVVERARDGRCTCIVWPEYRIVNGKLRLPGQTNSRKVKPVHINMADFGLEGTPYIWAYEIVS